MVIRKIYKKALSFSLFLCLASTSITPLFANPEEIAQESLALQELSSESITQEAKKAKKTITNHTRATHALIALGLGQQGFAIYSFLKDISEPAPKKPTEPDNTPRPGFWKTVGDGLASLADPETWPMRCLAIGKVTMTMLGHVVVNQQIHKLLATVSHDDTVFWFRDTQTSYNEVASDVTTYAEKLAQLDPESEQYALCKQQLTVALQDMVHQLEKIIGYTWYKKTSFARPDNMTYKELGATLSKQMFSQTNDFVATMNQLLTENGDQKEYAKHIATFTEQMDTLMDDFARLDPDTQVHRSRKLIESKKALANIGRSIVQLPPDLLDRVKVVIAENKERKLALAEEAVREKLGVTAVAVAQEEA